MEKRMKAWKPTLFLLLAGLSSQVWAADCSVEISSNDAMQFDKTSISVPQSCKQFTVKLKHSGKMAKNVMGHNWVLTKTADMQGVASDGIAAGLDKSYLKVGDARVIAHTKVVGGGESDTVSFAPSKLKAGEAYSFFCSFPGHSGIMKGTVQVTK
jgi:azurin